jgi:penicillin-binding protein 2
MRFADGTQNLRARLNVVQCLVLLMFVVLAVRLYDLQVVRGDYYAERAASQRVRVLNVRAPRGAILDREGRLLVSSHSAYSIVLSRSDMRGRDFDTLTGPLAHGLDLDPEYLRERFAEARRMPAFESFSLKEEATPADLAWLEARRLEFPELRVERRPQRSYPAGGLLAHVLGYVGEISSRQLELPAYSEKGYKPGDIIGKEGLEAVYDEYLRGRDGSRTLVVDSLARTQGLLEEVAPQPGQDLVTTIDLDLQLVAEEQLRNTPTGRGVIVAMNPSNGEILALASYPTFDPNLFSQHITTREGRAEYAALLRDPRTPLFNRAIRGRYPPGSTWKIPMAMAGLMQGAITVEDSRLACGGGIQVGNKFTRCMGHHGRPDLHTAIMKSCDGYFYRLGLKMELEGIMEMVEDFEINERTGVDLPGELRSWTPSREFKARFNPRDPEWRDIDTVYASFGQVYDFVTPLALLRTVSGIAMGGRLPVPHLMKEFRPVGLAGEDGYRTPVSYQPSRAKYVPVAAEQHELVTRGMWSVVNGPGTAARIRMEGFEIAGKTGTAQVVSLGKDTGDNKDHAWFVSYAPADKPEIAVVALIENVGFGGTHAAPAARAVYDAYYLKTRTLHTQEPTLEAKARIEHEAISPGRELAGR